MPGQMPSRIGAARLAWSDLAATVRAHSLHSLIAIAACTVTSLANAYLNPPDDASTAAIVRGLALAVFEAFAITPMLLASHRFIILGEVSRNYAAAVLTPRFWRFLLLSMAVIALVFIPPLLTRRFFNDAITGWVLVAGVAGFVATSALLALLFPAIAVDAPGMGVRNAVADLWGNVWRIFSAGMLALLPLMILTILVGSAQGLIFDNVYAWPVRLAFAPLEGAFVAATYVLLVLIASRFYLAAADRLK